MAKIAVVYWSGTGNTEAMAQAVADGGKEAGAEVDMIAPAAFSSDKVGEYDAIGFGCPSMGVEVLEEEEFEPMFTECENELSGKKIGLFGSYGWGQGEWMTNWRERCEEDGADLVTDPVICQEAPEGDTLDKLKDMGKQLAS